MNRTMLNSTQAIFVLALLSARSLAADSSSEAPVFKDKILEKAVRKFVFDKRDNDKPIVETDVVNLSTIQGVGMEIADLSGLEKCASLASLDLSKNKIKDLTPLVKMAKKDFENEKRFAPFLNLYVKGNSTKGSQKAQLKDYGVRLND